MRFPKVLMGPSVDEASTNFSLDGFCEYVLLADVSLGRAI